MFKIGDRIICINDKDMGYITEGVSYIVKDVIGSSVYVKTDGGHIGRYHMIRFKLYELTLKRIIYKL